MRLVYCTDFDYTLLDNIKNVRRPRGNNGTLSKKVYKELWCAFDIETTRIDDDNSIMYVWQFQLDDKCTIIGRTWDEFKSFAKKLKRKLAGAWLVVYVHNLSYEFSFLKGIYNFDPEEVFCLNGRKVLKCDMYGALEFRCSYYQNNTSLAVFAKQWAKTQKESGEEYNYNKTRYPWTPLTEEEIKYIQADVISLVEAISAKARYFGDTQITIPLTATGYIRKTVKQKMRGGFNHNQLQELLPDAELTLKLVEAFRGGNTHASRFYANQVLNNVGSFDISSAYPAAQVTELFPMTAWYKYKDPRSYTIEHVIDLMGSNKALLLEVTFYELGLKNLNGSTWGNPYISRHKCRDLVGGIYDNGRVLYAERLTTVVTDIDFKILLQEYQFSDIDITFLAASTYKKLPSVLTDYTIELFKKKTELKGVAGSEVEYRLSKERINSIYGMSVTNPLKEDVKYINGEFKKEALDFQARIEKENKKAFQSYAWG